jgi:anti-sigma B factor antagonist
LTATSIDIDPTRIDVRAATSSSGTTVHVSGEVDSTTAPGLRNCLLEVIARPVAGAIEVDLREVTFLDSAGLSALATAHRAAEAAGRILQMRCGTTRAVLRPLQITGLWAVFAVID